MSRMDDTAADPKGGDEQELIERACDGDVDALDSLIRRYEDQVYSVAYRLLGDADDAADIVQEVFLALFRHIRKYRGRAKLSTWLHRVTVNTVKNFWIRQKRRGADRTHSLDTPANPDDPPPIESLADAGPRPDRIAAGTEMIEVVERKLLELDPEFRQVIVLRFMEGWTYEEVAEAIGEPVGTIKSRTFRARRALKDLMEDYLEEL